jgi:AcrR family transcriptional regulator
VSTRIDEPNRRADIVRAAARLFREKGYTAATIRDIADAVGMRSGSPFYHFKTKHDILLAVVLEGITTIQAAVVAAAKAKRTPRKKFEAMVTAHLRALLDNEGRDFAATLLHESRHLAPTEQAEVTAHRDSYEQLWRTMLSELKQAGLLREDSSVVRLFVIGAMNWTTQWYHDDGALNPDALATSLVALVLGDGPGL